MTTAMSPAARRSTSTRGNIKFSRPALVRVSMSSADCYRPDFQHDSKRRRSAFTKTELILVMVVLCVGFLLMPIPLNRAHESARQVQCKSNLHNIGLACQQHRKAWHVFPSGG